MRTSHLPARDMRRHSLSLPAHLYYVLVLSIGFLVMPARSNGQVSRMAHFTDMQQDDRGAGLEVEILHQVRLDARKDGWPKAFFLPDDARHLGQSLGYTLRHYPNPHNGMFLASLHNFTIARFGIVCNASHAFSVFSNPMTVGNYVFDGECFLWGDNVKQVETGLFLLTPYGGFWQHFMQDLLYKIAFATDSWSGTNMSLIIESNSAGPIQDVIRRFFGNSDPTIVTMDSDCLTVGCKWHIHAKNLLVAETYPQRADVGWPVPRYVRLAQRKLAENLARTNPDDEQRYIVFLGRGGKSNCNTDTRCVRNEVDVLRAMQWFANMTAMLDTSVGKLSGVKSVVLDRNTHTMAQAATILRHAAIIVAPHGGQTYNAIFAQAGAIFIELTPTKSAGNGPYSVHNFVTSLGLTHWLLPVTTAIHDAQSDETPFVVDTVKLIRVLLHAMALLPLEAIGLGFQISEMPSQDDGSNKRICFMIEWEVSNLDIAIQDWCQGYSCLHQFVVINGTRVSGTQANRKASCHMAGVLSECLPQGSHDLRLELCSPWRGGHDCVTSRTARVHVSAEHGPRGRLKATVFGEAAAQMTVPPHCSMEVPELDEFVSDGPEECVAGIDVDAASSAGACAEVEEYCVDKTQLDLEDLPPPLHADDDDDDDDDAQAEPAEPDVVQLQFLDLREGKLVFPYRLVVVNLAAILPQVDVPAVYVCIDIEDKRECYDVDVTQRRFIVKPDFGLTFEGFKQAGEFVMSAFLATLPEGESLIPVGVETDPVVMVGEPVPEPKLCVVVPYRDGCHGRQQGKGRAHNRKTFLRYMQRFLGRVRKNWEIIVAEQTQHGLFNKGVLFNVGAHVGETQRKCDYFTMHDVDQIPTNPQNDYGWRQDPTHMCTYSTQYTYSQWPPPPHVGGVLMSTLSDYKEMNGYSNKYHGWGLEDNDQYWRLVKVFDKVERLPQTIGHYRDLPHDRVMGLDNTESYNESQKVLDALVASEGTAYTDTDGYSQILEAAQIEDVRVRGRVVYVLAHVLKGGERQAAC